MSRAACASGGIALRRRARRVATEERALLLGEDETPALGGRLEERDRAEARILHGDERRDDRSLAVSDEPDARRIHLRTRTQPGHRGANVVGEVGGRRGGRPGVGAADAAIVEPQHDDAAARQRVGDLAKRPIAGHGGRRFVAVLRSGAGDQHDGGTSHARRATAAA